MIGFPLLKPKYPGGQHTLKISGTRLRLGGRRRRLVGSRVMVRLVRPQASLQMNLGFRDPWNSYEPVG